MTYLLVPRVPDVLIVMSTALSKRRPAHRLQPTREWRTGNVLDGRDTVQDMLAKERILSLHKKCIQKCFFWLVGGWQWSGCVERGRVWFFFWEKISV